MKFNVFLPPRYSIVEKNSATLGSNSCFGFTKKSTGSYKHLKQQSIFLFDHFAAIHLVLLKLNWHFLLQKIISSTAQKMKFSMEEILNGKFQFFCSAPFIVRILESAFLVITFYIVILRTCFYVFLCRTVTITRNIATVTAEYFIRITIETNKQSYFLRSFKYLY